MNKIPTCICNLVSQEQQTTRREKERETKKWPLAHRMALMERAIELTCAERREGVPSRLFTRVLSCYRSHTFSLSCSLSLPLSRSPSVNRDFLS